VEKLTQKLQEMREETEQVRRDSQAMIEAYQMSQENKAHTLGMLLVYLP
jgi:type III secretory pathway component EscR